MWGRRLSLQLDRVGDMAPCPSRNVRKMGSTTAQVLRPGFLARQGWGLCSKVGQACKFELHSWYSPLTRDPNQAGLPTTLPGQAGHLLCSTSGQSRWPVTLLGRSCKWNVVHQDMSAGRCEPCPLLGLYGIWSPVFEPRRFPQKSSWGRSWVGLPGSIPQCWGRWMSTSGSLSLWRNRGAREEEGEGLVRLPLQRSTSLEEGRCGPGEIAPPSNAVLLSLCVLGVFQRCPQVVIFSQWYLVYA